jgi:large subunit ribosomal protein L17
MIHRRKGRKFNRTASHRKALLSNLSVSLIKYKKIRTTLAKAKELRTYIEPIINKSKITYLAKDNKPESNVHARREVNRFLNDRGAVSILFDEIAPKVVDRNGGYTRVLKMGRRLGDGAELALIELVDYNLEQDKQEAKTDTEEKEGGKVKTKAKKTKKAAEDEDTGKTERKKTAEKKTTVKKKSTETKKNTEKKKTSKDTNTKSAKKKEADE